MKRVTVLLRSAPFGTQRLAEALRMSVGQTLGDHRVRLIFVADAVYILGEANPSLVGGGDVALPLETLELLGHELVAESVSLESRGVRVAYPSVRRADKAEVARSLLESDVVLTW